MLGKGGSHTGKKSKTDSKSATAKGKEFTATPMIATQTFSVTSLTSPRLTVGGPFVDCGCALLSRQFDSDREEVIDRAKDQGCSSIITWFSDIDKQSQVSEMADRYNGYVYSLIGVHPDNIDKTNKKLHANWLTKTEELARKSTCVGILTGLNLGRENTNVYAMESLFLSSISLASQLKLPVILHLSNDHLSFNRAIELLSENGYIDDYNEGTEKTKDVKLVIHDAIFSSDSNPDLIQKAVLAGFYFSLSGHGICSQDGDEREAAAECLALIPKDKLQVCSDSPWKTPQNLSDEFMRTQRNESSKVWTI